jgi:O-antigen/teichoic acid export membrane protein
MSVSEGTSPAAPAAAPALPFDMRRVGRHTIIYAVGILLSRAVSVVMLPIYTRYLTPADYGVLELIGMTLEVIAIFAGAQIALGIFRYYHKAESEAERNAVVSTALLGLGISYVLVGAIALTAAAPISRLVWGSAANAGLLRIAAIGFMLQSMLIVPLAYARVRDRALLFVGANAVKLVISLSVNLWLVVGLRWGVAGVLWSSIIANLIVGAWLAAWVVREVGLRISRRATRDLLRYGLPMMATWAATFIVTYGDRYFLQAHGGSAIVGLYGLAYTFGFILALVGYMPFMQVWEQKRFEIAKRPDRDALLADGFVYLNVMVVSAALGIALFVGDFLRIASAPAFHEAARLVPLILVAYVLQGWTSLQDTGILVRERTEFVSLGNWIAAIVALAGYAVLIPRYLGFGAALATVIAFATRHVIVYSIAQRLWPVRYRWRPVLYVVGIALAAWTATLLLPLVPLAISIPVRVAIFAAYLLAVWNGPVLPARDRAAVVRTVRELATSLRSRRRRSLVEVGTDA